MRSKRLLIHFLITLFMIVSIVPFPARAESTSASSIEVKETSADQQVMPDSFNSGCFDTSTQLDLSAGTSSVGGIVFKESGGFAVIDYLNNKNASGTYFVDDCDFSNYPIRLYHTNQYTSDVVITFRNCRFLTFESFTGAEGIRLSFRFENCSFARFYGSNASFDRCFFGGSYRDGMIPFQNVTAVNCYFGSFQSSDPAGKGIHTDGVQLYGSADVMVKNISFDHCRFEVSPIHMESGSAINACIMLQMEYNNAENVSFTNCTVNGGGYSIYARTCKNAEYMKDITFDGIQVGNAKRYGTVYPTFDDVVDFRNISGIDSLFVGSVWKKNGKVHLCVTNDTGRDRTLTVITDSGTYQYSIKACPSGDIIRSNDMKLSELPVDEEIIVPANSSYVVCYDSTIDKNAKQIRFVNWGSQRVFLRSADTDLGKPSRTVISSGACGREVEYTLYSDGELVLSGSGATYHFDINKLPLWDAYSDLVRTVTVKSGVTELGAQIFTRCSYLESAVLEEGVSVIGSRAFAQCSMMTDLSLPSTLQTIEKSAFTTTALRRAYFSGSDAQWKAVSIGSGNEPLTACIQKKVITSGLCGKSVTYTLYADGVMVLSGSGATYNFHSGFLVPWYEEYRNQVKEVRIEGGVTSLGEMVFEKHASLTKVIMEEGVTSIGHRAFSSCKSLKEVVLPASMTTINSYVFDGTAIESVEYRGTVSQWNAINIKVGNSKLTACGPVQSLRPLEECSISLAGNSYQYTGKQICPEVSVRSSEAELRAGTDYIVTYQNNIHPGKGTVLVKGAGIYTGTVELPFEIRQDLAKCESSLSADKFFYTGQEIKPDVTVLLGGSPLKAGTDYTVTYQNNIRPGKGTVLVKGAGFYTGRVELSFEIQQELAKCESSLGADRFFYTGQEIKPEVTVLFGGSPLKEGTDYTVSYRNNVEVGTATAVVSGRGFFCGTIFLPFTIEKEILSEGKCGREVNYVLYSDGLMVISGSGPTYNFHSGFLTPWYEQYRNQVKTVRIEKGVTGLGNQLFVKHPELTRVVIEDGVKTIGHRTFFLCSKLEELTLPSSIAFIDSHSFASSGLQKAVYAGDMEQWAMVDVVNEGNDILINHLVFGSAE